MVLARFIALTLTLLLAQFARAAEVYVQPPHPSSGQYKSSWYSPDGLDDDAYVWDAFTLAADTAITEVRWRGAYTNYLSGAGTAPVYNFTVAIYSSIAGGSQPDVVSGRLVRYHVGSNAGETPAGSAGGVAMYDYHFALPSPFQAVAGTRYWIQIYAWQGLTPTYHWPPDWSIARGTGGDGSHFRRVGGTGGMFHSITGDCAFSLYSSDAPTVTIAASASPTIAGVVTGAGAYPIGSTVTLNALPSTGWGFVNWTQGGSQVSTKARYTFPATVDRSLVANFVPAYTITTSASPTYGGTITGAGIYNQGSTVTLVATPEHGFDFAGWSDGATTPTHSFAATSNVWITAFFVSSPLSETFTFDNAPAYTTLPLDLTVDGLSAHFSASSPSGGTFAIWPYDTWGISPPGFEGLSLFPTSVFGADLIAEFSEPLVDFSVLYSPQELGCDDSATLRATAYMDGDVVGTSTITAPNPGTYPVATLRIAVPGGFNRVVVHYDSPPPTCQDWGPIFFADNVTVTRLGGCAADFNGDGFGDILDFLDFIDDFAFCENQPAPCGSISNADFNGDTLIDILDFLDFLDAFGTGC